MRNAEYSIYNGAGITTFKKKCSASVVYKNEKCKKLGVNINIDEDLGLDDDTKKYRQVFISLKDIEKLIQERKYYDKLYERKV